MQYNDLRIFLQGVTSPEYAEQLITAAEQLTLHGIFQHELAITNALDVASDSNDSVTIATIESILLTTYREVLADHGILIQEFHLPIMVSLVNTLYTVDAYGDPAAIYDICNAEMSPEETFAEIVSLTSQWSVEDVLMILSSVESSLIERIYELSSDSESNQINFSDDYDENVDILFTCRARLREYLQNNRNLLIGQRISEGLNIGLPIDVYVESSRDALEELQGSQVVRELYGMALASCSADDEIKSIVDGYLPELIANGNELLEAQAILATELGE